MSKPCDFEELKESDDEVERSVSSTPSDDEGLYSFTDEDVESETGTDKDVEAATGTGAVVEAEPGTVLHEIKGQFLLRSICNGVRLMYYENQTTYPSTKAIKTCLP